MGAASLNVDAAFSPLFTAGEAMVLMVLVVVGFIGVRSSARTFSARGCLVFF